MNIKKIIRWPFFPYLLVCLALLDFYIEYYFEISINELLITTLVTLLFISLVWLVFFRLLKDLKKSSLVVFFFSVIFFEFPSITLALRKISNYLKLNNVFRFWNSDTGQWVVLCFLMCLIVWLYVHYKRAPKVHPRTIVMFNLVSLILILMFIVRGVVFIRGYNRIPADIIKYWDQQLAKLPAPPDATAIKKPDIYYIVFDGFGRSDVLNDLYGVDNASFLQGLKSRGFFVADESYSNYNQTSLSLASSMNMRYLDDMAELLGENTYNSYASIYMIENSSLEAMLHRIGYQTAGFYSETFFTDFRGRDYYFHPKNVPPRYFQTFLRNTALSVILNTKLYDWHRNTITFSLETLPDVTKIKGSQFTFAHILCPHPPFVFNTDGTPREPDRFYGIHDANRFLHDGTVDEYRTGYKNQVTYLQEEILTMVDRIQQNSTEPYILILQGDHGPGSETNQDKRGVSNATERHGILNAVYFFDQDYDRLYSKISPVNTFRVIFSQYLGIEEPLLNDLHYASTYGDSFNYESVDNQLK